MHCSQLRTAEPQRFRPGLQVAARPTGQWMVQTAQPSTGGAVHDAIVSSETGAGSVGTGMAGGMRDL